MCEVFYRYTDVDVDETEDIDEIRPDCMQIIEHILS
jgi:hypothetical protein